MTKQQIINLAVTKLSEMAVGISIKEIERIVTKVADLVEAETVNRLSAND